MEVQASTPLVQPEVVTCDPNSWWANRGDVEVAGINRNFTATRNSFSLNFSLGPPTSVIRACVTEIW